ncbi:hypothetical protein AALA98_15425 [Lachnospiraceae bacterium 45-W7]
MKLAGRIAVYKNNRKNLRRERANYEKDVCGAACGRYVFSALFCGMPFGAEDALAKSAAKVSDGFVKIEGGKFTMGSPKKEAEREND